MAFLENVKFRNKLIVMLFFPIVGLLYFSFMGVSEKLETSNQMNSIEKVSSLAVHLSSLVHEVQKERGATAGFLTSKGAKFSDILRSQRKQTNEKLNVLTDFLNDFDQQAFSKKFAADLGLAINQTKQIKKIRNSVTNFKISTGEAIGYYTKINSLSLNMINYLPKLTENAQLATAGAAYVNFLQGKERAGIERAVMSSTFAANRFTPVMFKKFNTLVAEQKTYSDVFLTFATDAQTAFWRQKMSAGVVSKVKQMEQIAFDSSKRANIVQNIPILTGYGGMIHNFKNFVLRGGDKRLKKFNAQISNVYNHIDLYSKINNVSDQDLKDLKILKTTLEKYQNATKLVSRMRADKKKPLQIDKVIKINDGPAIESLERLTKGGSFGVDPEHWFKTITGKINILKEIENSLSTDLKSLAAVLNRQAYFTFILYIVITSVALLLSFALSILIGKEILTQLGGEPGTVAGLVEEIAEGDLTVTFESTKKVDTGIFEAIKTMTKKLQTVIGDVISATGNVTIGSTELSSASQQLSQGAAEQAASIEEVSSSMEQMTSNIQQNTDSAHQTESIASKSANDAIESGLAVEKAMEAMKQIANKISIIEEIARQTNLLALNAAIEAARAGEHGKGFAVVASEVRKLAERSQVSAGEITELSSTSVDIAEQAGDMLKRLVPDIQKTAGLIKEISVSSSEQYSGAEQINAAIQQLDQVIQQNASSSEEIASTAEELAAQAQMLGDTMGFFNVGQQKNLHKVSFSQNKRRQKELPLL